MGNYNNKDCLETFEVKRFAWWVYVYLARFVGFFKKYFKRKKTLYVLLQWKKYDPCMERRFVKVSELNCSLLKPRSVNIYFIWFVLKLIVEQIYLKTIFNPDFKFLDFLPGIFIHMSFMMSFFIPIYRIYFIFLKDMSCLVFIPVYEFNLDSFSP